MTHDQRCRDSNRFGDGFDCICEPDWRAEARRLAADLATERAAREQAEKRAEILETCHAPNRRVEQAERERVTALESAAACARTAEHFRWERDAALFDLAFAKSQRDDNESAWQCEKQKRVAAESALASARETLNGRYTFGQMVLRLRALLSSHPSPAPVAEQEPGENTEALIEQLDEALCSLLHTGGEFGEHSPRAHLDLFYARSAAPVAAPCAECEELRYRVIELELSLSLAQDLIDYGPEGV